VSERLEHTETEEILDGAVEEIQEEPWVTGEHYSRMQIETGNIGNLLYLGLPALTFLAKSQEELEAINTDISGVLSKYTDGIIVGSSHEASLILSINQAAVDLSTYSDAVNALRVKIFELTGSYEAAGDWKPED
jgi:hypothetical protein